MLTHLLLTMVELEPTTDTLMMMLLLSSKRLLLEKRTNRVRTNTTRTSERLPSERAAHALELKAVDAEVKENANASLEMMPIT